MAKDFTNEWREKALEMFPELAPELTGPEASVDTPYLLWFELLLKFQEAYLEPRNEDLIKKTYEYARWCEHQPRGTSPKDDLFTCVAVCFYEHIPEKPEQLKDMPRWFTRKDVIEKKDIFVYTVGESGFEEILKQFGPEPGSGPKLFGKKARAAARKGEKAKAQQ